MKLIGPPNLTNCPLLAVKGGDGGWGERPSLVQKRNPLKHLKSFSISQYSTSVKRYQRICKSQHFIFVLTIKRERIKKITLPTLMSSLLDRYVDPKGSWEIKRNCIIRHKSLKNSFRWYGLSFPTWIWRVVRVDAICVIERIKTTETYQRDIRMISLKQL